MSENELLVLFGTETGNAEDLAFEIGRKSVDFGLKSTVKGMEEVTLSDVSACQRLMICCSTWGEGDQPDNAQELYDQISESVDGCLASVHFSVLALGDTAFEMFCESGKQWDTILEKKGARRINDRVDCDTDYEDDAEIWIESTLKLMQNY
jgi:sulfite reductase alpha subunit-like flavoprotein|tara:strand:- start:359 stop:811 length:453 start_codon:yes stop_codon:yes gene_type:complete